MMTDGSVPEGGGGNGSSSIEKGVHVARFSAMVRRARRNELLLRRMSKFATRLAVAEELHAEKVNNLVEAELARLEVSEEALRGETDPAGLWSQESPLHRHVLSVLRATRGQASEVAAYAKELTKSVKEAMQAVEAQRASQESLSTQWRTFERHRSQQQLHVAQSERATLKAYLKAQHYLHKLHRIGDPLLMEQSVLQSLSPVPQAARNVRRRERPDIPFDDAEDEHMTMAVPRNRKKAAHACANYAVALDDLRSKAEQFHRQDLPRALDALRSWDANNCELTGLFLMLLQLCGKRRAERNRVGMQGYSNTKAPEPATDASADLAVWLQQQEQQHMQAGEITPSEFTTSVWAAASTAPAADQIDDTMQRWRLDELSYDLPLQPEQLSPEVAEELAAATALAQSSSAPSTPSTRKHSGDKRRWLRSWRSTHSHDSSGAATTSATECMTLDAAMSGLCGDAFSVFLQRHVCAENLEFLTEVRHFRAAPDAAKATALYERYIRTDASDHVNISAEAVYQVESRLEGVIDGTDDVVPGDVFDPAIAQVRALLRTDCLPKFMRSPEYKQYLRLSNREMSSDGAAGYESSSKAKKKWFSLRRKSRSDRVSMHDVEHILELPEEGTRRGTESVGETSVSVSTSTDDNLSLTAFLQTTSPESSGRKSAPSSSSSQRHRTA
ncbi:MAG: hypothetical protein MHM6MM_001306 [Cercozoa sp. M6MM]